MSTRDRLLVMLADGRFHSGTSLGRQLGLSRSAIHKQIRSLEELDLAVQAVTGKGYRLARPLELLDGARILSTGGLAGERLARVEVLPDIDSTNQYLLALARRGAPSGYAVFAERQRAGRGRRGRAWQSPFGENVYMSLLWRFDTGIAAMAGLTLAIGVGVVRAVRALGVDDACLKWPNDVIWHDRKLAGVLVEVAGEVNGPCAAVIGIGLNLYLPRPAAARVTQPWCDLETALGRRAARNAAAGVLLRETVTALERYRHGGLAPFVDEWRALDGMRDRAVELHTDAGVVRGAARGIDGDGALIVESGGERRRYPCGEVSLRLTGRVARGADLTRRVVS